MLFNSLRFLLVFPLIFGVYWAIPARYNTARKVFLIVLSYLLYMNWRPAPALLLLAVTLLTYGGGIWLGKSNKPLLAWLLAILALLPMLVFKFHDGIDRALTAALSAAGLHFTLQGLNWALPVGITFFTMQALGYMLDVYHGRIRPEKNLADYMLFVCFFPQLVAGPISKASDLLPQIKEERRFNYTQAVDGLKCLLWGMFLKVALADRAGIVVDKVFDGYELYSAAGFALNTALYGIQIYADFAGYSLMAVGVAKVLGFDLVNNFRRPFLAQSITDFWRRWHISLTRWLRDQVYIPLGGNRCSKLRNYANILVTFLVSGLWHGASWNFLLWGGYHGLLLVGEKALGWHKKESTGVVKALRIVLTFSLVSLGWLLFREASASSATLLGYFSRLVSLHGRILPVGGGNQPAFCLLALLPLLVYEFLAEFRPERYARLQRKPALRWAAWLAVFALIVLIGVHDGSSFIYERF